MYKDSQKKIDKMPAQKRGTKNLQKEGKQFPKEGQSQKRGTTIPKQDEQQFPKEGQQKTKKDGQKFPKKRGPKTW